MTLTAQVRLTSWFLGEMKPDHQKIRRFKTTSIRQVAVNQNYWLTEFAKASRDLGLDVDVRRAIVPPDGIIAATIHLYRRTYSKVFVEMFEAFRERTILTFNLRILEEIPKHPTVSEMAGILRFTGQFLGLSQFGSKFGYGRFELLSIAPINPALFLIPDESVPSSLPNAVPSNTDRSQNCNPNDARSA